MFGASGICRLNAPHPFCVCLTFVGLAEVGDVMGLCGSHPFTVQSVGGAHVRWLHSYPARERVWNSNVLVKWKRGERGERGRSRALN